jgi:hypothetical protein
MDFPFWEGLVEFPFLGELKIEVCVMLVLTED